MSLACVPKENMGDTSLLSFFFFFILPKVLVL